MSTNQTVSLAGNPQAGAPYGMAYFDLPSGLTLTVTVPAATAQTAQGGRLKRIDPQTGAVLETYALVASQVVTMGPFATNRRWRIEVDAGSINYTIDQPDNQYASGWANVQSFVGNYTLQVSDNGKLLRCDDTSNVTVTVPGNLPTGFNVGFAMWGTGTVTVAAGAGATKRGSGATIGTQYESGHVHVGKNADGNSAEFILGGSFA
jgi:hypothetical protein